MNELIDLIFPTLSDELIHIILLIVGLLTAASIGRFIAGKISPKAN